MKILKFRIYDWFLLKSKIARRWYKKARLEDISEFLFDLERIDIEKEEISKKWLKKYKDIENIKI